MAVPAHLVKKKAFRIQKLVLMKEGDPRIVIMPEVAEPTEAPKRGPGRPPKSETQTA